MKLKEMILAMLGIAIILGFIIGIINYDNRDVYNTFISISVIECFIAYILMLYWRCDK